MGVGNRIVRYLAGLSRPRLVLWCYLLWYLVVLVRYFDPNPRIWLTSLGLSFIVGVALVLNARSGARGSTTPGAIGAVAPASPPNTGAATPVPLGTWAAVRFFMAPFCVSSFAALVKGRGFILVFSPHLGEIAAGILACGALVAARGAARHVVARAGAAGAVAPGDPVEPVPEGPVRAVGNG